MVVAGWALLVVAAGLVGVAIELDSDTGRALNGVGGLLWLGGAGLLVSDARRAPLGARTWAVVGLAVVALSTLLSPRDLGAASVAFFVGGWAVVLLGRRGMGWLTAVGLLPALWLPTHLAVAGLRALYRTVADQPADIRTDPPPTAALVPLAMVIMAFVGGKVGGYLAELRARNAGTPVRDGAGEPVK